jgi:hypothetical protein
MDKEYVDLSLLGDLPKDGNDIDFFGEARYSVVDGRYVGPDILEGSLVTEDKTKFLKDLNNLKKVSGNLDVLGLKHLESLGDLDTVDGYVRLSECPKISSLGKLRHVGEWLDLKGTDIEEITCYVNGSVYLSDKIHSIDTDKYNPKCVIDNIDSLGKGLYIEEDEDRYENKNGFYIVKEDGTKVLLLKSMTNHTGMPRKVTLSDLNEFLTEFKEKVPMEDLPLYLNHENKYIKNIVLNTLERGNT